MRPLRFRVRTLMVAVAVVASGLGFVGRVAAFRRQAGYHSRQASRHFQLAGGQPYCLEGERGNTAERFYALVDDCERESAQARKAQLKLGFYHFVQERRFRQAADRPWLSLAPDPPPP